MGLMAKYDDFVAGQLVPFPGSTTSYPDGWPELVPVPHLGSVGTANLNKTPGCGLCLVVASQDMTVEADLASGLQKDHSKKKEDHSYLDHKLSRN